MPTHSCRSFLHWGLLPLVTACGPGDRPGWHTHIDDLPMFTAREELRIGSVDDPDVGFSDPGDVAVDRDGNVYIVELRDDQVRAYDTDGNLVRVLGRSGQGPGEFRYPSSLGFVGDTLWVADEYHHRVTLFDRSGTLLRSTRMPRTWLEPLPGIIVDVFPSALRPDGRFNTFIRVSGSGAGLGVDTIHVPRLVFDSSESIVDTVGSWLVLVPFERTITVKGREVHVPRVHDGPQSIDALDGHIRIRWYSEADPPIITITRVDLADDTIFHTAMAYMPTPYEDEERTRVASSNTPRQFGEEQDAAVREVRDATRFPPFLPPITYRVLGSDESVWLMRQRLDPVTGHWIIIAPDGSPLGRFELPSSNVIRWAGGDVFWVTVRDSLDVPFLVRYRLVPR